MTRVAINGIHLNVEVAGRGPAIAALHGFTGSLATWDAFAKEASEDYTLVRLDLHGHGSSDAPVDSTRYRMEHCLADLETLLDRLGHQRVHWLGYSMGGRIALSAAIALPHRTLSLVAESASPGLATAEERAERIKSDEALAQWAEAVGAQRFVEYWEALPLFATQQRLSLAVREKIRAQREKTTTIGLANSLRGIGTGAQPALYDKLSRLKAPALLLAGEEDTKFVEIAHQMHGAISNSEVMIIPGVGHAAHLEKPEQFNSAVLGFLARTQVAIATSRAQ